MPVTVTLSTTPATMTRETWGITMSLDLLGPSLGSETLPAVSSVAEIRAAVARFGAQVRAAHSDASFYVSVRLAKGQRKPNGFDAARRNNGLGQEDFIRLADRRTEPDAPAVAWLEQARA